MANSYHKILSKRIEVVSSQKYLASSYLFWRTSQKGAFFFPSEGGSTPYLQPSPPLNSGPSSSSATKATTTSAVRRQLGAVEAVNRPALPNFRGSRSPLVKND
jgi:hypothetical protein